MTAAIMKILVLCCVAAVPLIAAAPQRDGVNNLLDVETPSFFNYNSPLRQPDSLRSRPYFDFLSTLYRRDATKTNLFRPYIRQRRSVDADVKVVDADATAVDAAALAPAAAPEPAAKISLIQEVQPKLLAQLAADVRPKRAIVFRPVFVYKQQMIRKEELRRKRRKRV